MNTLARLIVSSFFVLSISACSTKESGASKTQENFKELEDKGIVPKLDRSDDLAGPDRDNNGIRDDVDDYINKKYTDPKEKATAWQMARAFQMVLVQPMDTVEDAKVISDKIFKAIRCGNRNNIKFYNFEAITYNTKKRTIQYLKFNDLMDGTVSSMPEGDTCEKYSSKIK